jgi:hypothetical protein
MKHLRVLEDAGLVSQEKTGRVRRCRLAVQPLKQATEWLSYYRIFWENQLNALDRYLIQEQTHNKPRIFMSLTRSGNAADASTAANRTPGKTNFPGSARARLPRLD